MGTLPTRGRHPIQALSIAHHDASKMDPTVGPSSQPTVDDRLDPGTVQIGVAHHGPQRWTGEQLE